MIPRFRVYNTVLKRMLTDDEAKMACAFMDGGLYPAANCILMQSTGLQDKNGKEIFDGDIVVEKHDRPSRGCGMQVVRHEEIGWWPWCENTMLEGIGFVQEDWEVIGNIHEHSHLLPSV